MWEYLESLGVFENGSDAEIKAGKRAYRKKYFTDYKRRQRTKKPEYTANFTKENGELETILKGAKRHSMSVPTFLRVATLAYLNHSFVVPNRELVAHLEQLLADCLNEVQTIARSRDRFFWDKEAKIEKIEKRIARLEESIDTLFRHPSVRHDRQNQIT